MKKNLLFWMFVFVTAIHVTAQVEPEAGSWKPWFVSQGKSYRLSLPPSTKDEITEVLSSQRNVDSAGLQKILYWNAGSPGYRWYNMISKLFMTDPSGNGALSQMLVGTGIYDATIVAWDTKYAFNRVRPFDANSKIKALIPKPESPSYPC